MLLLVQGCFDTTATLKGPVLVTCLSGPLISLFLSSVSFVSRYEEEVALRATAENEFVALKKVSGLRMLPQIRTKGRGNTGRSAILKG